MKIKRLLLAILLPAVSAGILLTIVFGVPAGISSAKMLQTAWLTIPLVIILAIAVIVGLYKTLGFFSKEP